jgi:flagellar motor switch protein FliN/FliY
MRTVNNQMKLSQAEIDALLHQGANTPTKTSTLTAEEADILGEIGNINFGSAATSLSTLLQQRVDITTPSVSVIHPSEIERAFKQPFVLVAVEFTEGLQGSNALAIEVDDAKTIADLMLGGDGTNIDGELNELHLSAVGEAMNQMMGGAATSMSQMFGRYINISPPKVNVIDFSSEGQNAIQFDEQMVNVEFELRVGSLIDSRIMQLLPIGFAREMVSALQADATQTSVVSSAPEGNLAKATQDQPHAAQPMASGGAANAVSKPPSVEAKQVQMPQFVDFDEPEKSSTHSQQHDLSLLFDVPLNVTVELGRARKVIREILELSPGSILELDKLAGEPVDILVNNKRIAIGEVVVIDENFGVRVTDIVNPDRRITKDAQ